MAKRIKMLAPAMTAREFQARVIGQALADRDLRDGRAPAGVEALDWWHLDEIFSTPCPVMTPAQYRELVGWADGGYWTAVDEAIPAAPAVAGLPVLPAGSSSEPAEAENLDFSGVRSVAHRWRAAMDETLLILLDDAAGAHRWSAAQFCAAYARLAGPAETGRIFSDLLQNRP